MCDACRDLLPGFVAGHADPATQARVEAHLAECAGCRAEAAEWRRVADAVHARAAARVGELPPYRAPVDPAPAARAARTRGVPARAARWPAARTAALVGLAVLGAALTAWWRGAAPGVGTEGPSRTTADIRPAAPGAAAGVAPAAAGPGAAVGAVVRRPTVVARAGGGVALPVDRARDAATGTRESMAPATVGLSPGAGGKPGQAEPPAAPSTAPPAPAVTAARAPAGPAARTPAPAASIPPTVAATDTPVDTPTPAVTPAMVPTGTPAAVTGVITGTVNGPDGLPRAEILIVAEPDGSGAAPATTLSDVDGAFALTLPPGAWIVHAETPAFQLMWHPGRTNPIHAEPVVVAAGATAAVRFNLEPNPAGTIAGRVTDADGTPRARVAVIAAIPDDGDGGRPILTAAVYSDADGAYTLPVPPGAYLVAAGITRRFGDLVWWGGDGSLEQSDRLGVRGHDPTRADLVLGR